MFSEEEIYVRCSETVFSSDNDSKWEFVKPVPGVVTGMVRDRVLAIQADEKEVALLEQNQVWTSVRGLPHRLFE
jgi:hypothetical protein